MSLARNFALISGGVVLAVASATSASAQGYGHRPHYGHAPAHVCYEKVQIPDYYQTVHKRVLKVEARWETKEIAAEYGEVERQVLVKAGQWHVKEEAAVYETRERKVLVEAERQIVHFTPPQYKYQKVTHKVRDAYGHEKLVTHERKFLVKPHSKHVETKPAVYKTVQVKVLVKPAKVSKYWEAPVYKAVREKVVVRPAKLHKIYHPAVYADVVEKVLVKKGHVIARPVWKAHGEAC